MFSSSISSASGKPVSGYAKPTIASRAKVTKNNQKRRLCQEKYVCEADEQSVAESHCDECGTDQCHVCCEQLHLDPALSSHSPRSLVVPIQPEPEASVVVVCSQPISILAQASREEEDDDQWQECSTEDCCFDQRDGEPSQSETLESSPTVARKRSQRGARPLNVAPPSTATTTIASDIQTLDETRLSTATRAEDYRSKLDFDANNIDNSCQRHKSYDLDDQVDEDQDLLASAQEAEEEEDEEAKIAKLNPPGELSLLGGGGGKWAKKKRAPAQGTPGKQSTAVDDLIVHHPPQGGAMIAAGPSADGAGSSSDDSSGNSNSEGYVSSGSRGKLGANLPAVTTTSTASVTTLPMDIDQSGSSNNNKKKKNKKTLAVCSPGAITKNSESGHSSSCASSFSPGTSPTVPHMLMAVSKNNNPIQVPTPLINMDQDDDEEEEEEETPNIAQLSLDGAATIKIGGAQVMNKRVKPTKKMMVDTKRLAAKSKRKQEPRNLVSDDEEDKEEEREEDDDEKDEEEEVQEEEEAVYGDDDRSMTDIDLGGGSYRASPRATTIKNAGETFASTQEQPESFLLVNEEEVLQVKTAEEFVAKLGCSQVDGKTLVKVVSIFGNTGEGKSHTLNYAFYDCREVFGTSPTQNSCTIGIWCAYDRARRVITIDTEGLLGMSDNNNRRTRLLLKVLAISDVIIYRTRAERLHTDLFTFLGTASSAYIKHFAKELKAASERCNLQCTISDLGPVVIIFHETVYTEVLHREEGLAPEDIIRQRFNAMNLSTEAYSAFEYVGISTTHPPTNFSSLRATVNRHLTNSTVRSPRTPTVIFNALNVLSRKFSGDVSKSILNPFPDEYFTCGEHCLSCNARCSLSMNHAHDGVPHKSDAKCKYQHQYANQIFFCRSCFERGEMSPVTQKMMANADSAWMGMVKYAWAGEVLECKLCGIIHRSRQYWFGNKEPYEHSVVRTEILHLWNGEPLPSQSAQNAAQRMVDGMSYLSETVSTISAKPTKLMTDWLADRIAPNYWVPNARLQHCGKCEKEFADVESKHHCRRCGGGFCEDCSSKTQPVPERGWGDEPVRVCDDCFEKGERYADTSNGEVTARRVGEVLQNTLGSVISTMDYPLGEFKCWIKDSARPDYWVPDKECSECAVCKTDLNEKNPIHHCRACGQGVCDGCSLARKAVPNRGWDMPVRVCNECVTNKTVVKDV